MIRRSSLVVLAALVWTGDAAWANPSYTRYTVFSYPNPQQPDGTGTGHGIPACTVDGWDWTGDNVHHPLCPTLYDVYRWPYSCATDQPAPGGPTLGGPGAAAQLCCACNPSSPPPNGTCPNPEQLTDDAIEPANYRCEADNGPLNIVSQPEQCDGVSDGSVPVDRGCGDDEHTCSLDDADPAPVRYSSGRVQSNPITVFDVPAPGEILFGYRILYNSHVMRTAAQRNTVNSVHDDHPVIHHSEEDTHFIGRGWLDNFSDRLYISVFNLPATQITWTSQNGTVTFINSGGAWKSWSGKFELIDRGASPADGLGRWVVRTTDPSAPRKMWSFEEFTYTPYNGTAVHKLGRLRRHAVLTSNLADLGGRYGFTVAWTAIGTIASAIDTLGRELDFTYAPQTECVHRDGSGNCDRTETTSNRLASVQYKPAATAAAVSVVNLATYGSGRELERVTRPGVAGYTRFRYATTAASVSCVHCGALLSDVIVPGDSAASTPAPAVPPLQSEIVLEHDDYGPSPTPTTMAAVHSKSPGREYAYEYTQTSTTQFDLDQDGGPCGTGSTCPAGYACRTVNQLVPHCYVADIMQHDTATGLGTLQVPAAPGSPVIGVSGDSRAFSRHYTATGAPRDVIDASGNRTSYGYDSSARLRCIVRNDSDGEAFADPAHADTSACAGSTASQVVRIDYGATTITTTTPGVLGATLTEAETLDPVSLLTTARATTGSTRDIDGNTRSESHTQAIAYDSLGRITLRNGPLDDAVAYDATATSYYTAFDAAWPYNFGHVQTVTQYAGTVAANTPLTTTYAEYDVFGIPHRITGPADDQTLYTISADRLTVTISKIGSDGIPLGTSTLVLNANGTLRSQQDADGVCVTYQYADATGYVGAPTVMRRSNTGCGVLPVDQSSGEVEIRTYTAGERDRLQSIVRKTNGVVEMTYSGFSYDRDRRLVATTALDDAAPFSFGFTDVLLTTITSPGGPGPGRWKSELAADALGRPSSLSRYVDASNKQAFGYAYASTYSPRPTTITRGYNGAATSVTTLAYDDFGRLIGAATPELGGSPSLPAVRYEYDTADRVTRMREGTGTTAVATTAFSYDAIDRVTAIDHDLEHPVSCSTAAAGTAIQDEEYRYDSCPPGDTPSGFPCANPAGRLTMSRAILHCGSAHDVVKRGQWYSYDRAGRVVQVGYATVTGATIGPAAVMSYAYDAAGRMLSYTSPLNAAFGTRYTYGAADGRVATITTTAATPSPIASALTYRAFGGLTGYTTASTQTVTGGSRTLTVDDGYRSDDGLGGIVRSFVGSGTSSIDLVNQTFGYTAAGLMTQRTDTADPASSRYYGYDALQRLTCEVRNGTSADCTPSSSKLAGLFSYGNGENAQSPGDARRTAFLNTASYVSPFVENYVYTGGSTRPQDVNASGIDLVLGYDALGRRTSDQQNVVGPPPELARTGGTSGDLLPGLDPDPSRRDYTYLPGGQIGSIQGVTPSGDPYTVSLRYDAGGRPATIAYVPGDSYELFWDDADRLIAVAISGTRTVRWHYHYLGSTLIAATREVVTTSTSVKRFWVVSDERTLIARLVDEVGATYWQAQWDATGWRGVVGEQPDMWVPFGQPGQLILDGTEAVSSVGLPLRPALVLNQRRAYDPLVGGFLQTDPADQTGRLMPEGYLYGRGDYLGRVDISGADSRDRKTVDKNKPKGQGRSFDDSCKTMSPKVFKILNDQAMYDRIAADIDKCRKGNCGDDFAGPNIRREWKLALQTGKYFCAMYGWETRFDGRVWRALEEDDPGYNEHTAGELVELEPADTRKIKPSIESWARTITPGGKLANRQTLVGEEARDHCWERELAHEALHGVLDSLSFAQIEKNPKPALKGKTWGKAVGGFGHSVITGDDGLEMCILCK